MFLPSSSMMMAPYFLAMSRVESVECASECEIAKPTPCGPWPQATASDACATCFQTHCCDQGKEASIDQDAMAYNVCKYKCTADDSACVAACATKWGSAAKALIDAKESCLATSCPAQCGGADGGVEGGTTDASSDAPAD